MMSGGRGPGGPGGEFGDSSNPAAMGLPPGMGGMGVDSLGLGGLGTSAINGGFGGGQGGDPLSGGVGRGGPGGGPPGGGGVMRGGGGPGGAGGARGGGGGAGGRGQASSRRGPGGVDFASFGNRRSRSPYNGNLFLGLNNSALNAAPFSLTGQAAQKPSYAQSRFGLSFGGPLSIPKLFAWPRASFSVNYGGSISRNPYSQISSLPTAAERSGDFSLAHKTPIHDFRSAQPIAVCG